MCVLRRGCRKLGRASSRWMNSTTHKLLRQILHVHNARYSLQRGRLALKKTGRRNSLSAFAPPKSRQRDPSRPPPRLHPAPLRPRARVRPSRDLATAAATSRTRRCWQNTRGHLAPVVKARGGGQPGDGQGWHGGRGWSRGCSSRRPSWGRLPPSSPSATPPARSRAGPGTTRTTPPTTTVSRAGEAGGEQPPLSPTPPAAPAPHLFGRNPGGAGG